ncbi:MAG: STAS domain-containing protein [Paracoccaceae bacterium]
MDDDRRFPFRTEMRGDIVVLTFGASHYHADSHAALGAALTQAADAARAGRVIVDLSGVVLFSSTALRALRSTYVALEARGGRIVAAGGGELVAGVLKFAPFIEHYHSVDEAVAALSAAPSAKEAE